MTSLVQEVMGRRVNIGCECGYVCGKVNYTGTSADLNAIMQVYEAVLHGTHGFLAKSKTSGSLPTKSSKSVNLSISSASKSDTASSPIVGKDKVSRDEQRSATSCTASSEGDAESTVCHGDGTYTTTLSAFVHSFYQCARQHHAQCATTHGWLTLCESSLENYYYAFYDFINTVLKDCRTAAEEEKDIIGELWELKQERANVLEENNGRNGEYYKLHLQMQEEIQMAKQVLQTLREQNAVRRAHLCENIIAANAALEAQLASKRQAREAATRAAHARVNASIVAACDRISTLMLHPPAAQQSRRAVPRGDAFDARVRELVACGRADVDRDCALEKERIERGVREFAEKHQIRATTSEDEEQGARIQALRERMDAEREHRLATLDSELERLRRVRMNELSDRTRDGEAELEGMTAQVKMLEETLELNKDVVARLEKEAQHAEKLARQNADALAREQVRMQEELQAICERGDNEVRIQEDKLKMTRDDALSSMKTMEIQLDSLHHEAAVLRGKVASYNDSSSAEGGIVSDEMVLAKREELDALRASFNARKRHVVDYLENDFVKAVERVTAQRQRIVELKEEEDAAAEQLEVSLSELKGARERKAAMMQEMESEATEGRVLDERLRIAEKQALDASRELEEWKERADRDRKALRAQLQTYQEDVAQLAHDKRRPNDLLAELRQLEPNHSSLAAKLSVLADALVERQQTVESLKMDVADIAQAVRAAEDNAAEVNEAVEDMKKQKDEERQRLHARNDEELQNILKQTEDVERAKRRLESKLVLANSRVERMRKTQDMQRLMQRETRMAFEDSDGE